MDTNFSRASSLPTFSVDNYEIWKFRIKSYLTAQHCRMWEVITEGPIIILERYPRFTTEGATETTYETRPKSKADFNTEERKQDELDNLAKNVISGTVPDKHITKLMSCTTAKEMWDTLENMCAGSEETKENKLTVACQKFDCFKMLKGESIDEMEIRFSLVLSEIRVLRKDKYTQREINLRILWALPIEDWHVYAVSIRNRATFNELNTEQLFSALKAYEFDIQRTKSSAKAGSSGDEPSTKSKGAALKAAVKEKKNRSEKAESSQDDLLTQYNLMAERFSKMESKLKKFNRYRKRDSKRYENKNNHRSSRDRSDDTSKRPQQDTRDVECFGCGKKGHYKTDCPDLSHTERKALRAKRDRRYEKTKVMVADEQDDDSSESSSESESSSSDDESRCLMAEDVESCADSCMAGFDQELDESRVNSKILNPLSNNDFLHEQTSDTEDSSMSLGGIGQIMDDYRKLRDMYEDLMAENVKLKNISQKEAISNTMEEIQNLHNKNAEQTQIISNLESAQTADQEKMENLKKENDELSNKLAESVKIAEFYQTKVKVWENASSLSKDCIERQRPTNRREGIGFDGSKVSSFHQQKSKFIKFADSQSRETLQEIFPDSREKGNVRMLVRARAVIQPPKMTPARNNQYKAAASRNELKTAPIRKTDGIRQHQPKFVKAELSKKTTQQKKAEARSPAWYHRQQRWFQHQKKAEAQAAQSARSHRRQRWTQSKKAEVRTMSSAPLKNRKDDRIIYIDFQGRQVTAPHTVKVVRLIWVPKVKTNPKGPNLDGVPKV